MIKLLALAMFLGVAVVPAPIAQIPSHQLHGEWPGKDQLVVHRFVDDELNIVCYVTSWRVQLSPAMSCIKIRERK